MSRRLPLSIALAAALAVSGCGSEDPSDRAGTSTAAPTTTAAATDAAYFAAYERECRRLSTALSTYRGTFSDLSGRDPDTVVQLYRTETVGLLDAMGRMFTSLSAVDEPPAYADFQRSIEQATPQVSERIAGAKRQIRRIDTLAEVSTAGQTLQRALGSLSSAPFPAALRRAAPSCGQFT